MRERELPLLPPLLPGSQSLWPSPPAATVCAGSPAVAVACAVPPATLVSPTMAISSFVLQSVRVF